MMGDEVCNIGEIPRSDWIDTLGVSGAGAGRGVAEGMAVLGETPWLIAVTKPAGMLTHPKKPGGDPTLWDRLRELLAFELVNGGGVSIINRLDRETSGVVLVAKGREAANELCEAMQGGLIAKRYLCIVKGWPTDGRFEADAPLARASEVGGSQVAVRRVVHRSGLEARTRFAVVARLRRRLSPGVGDAEFWGEKFSLLEAKPVTGRTHQIRAHLHYLGYPIVGDKIYGPDDRLYLDFIRTGWTKSLERQLLLGRQALHSAEIGVLRGKHSGVWKAAMPADMRAFIAGLVEEGFER